MALTLGLTATVAAANEKFVIAFKQRDTAAIASLYTSDALVLPPHSSEVAGAGNIAAFWQAVLDMGIDTVTLETVDLEESGGGAVEVGHYTLKAGGQTVDQGKYVVVWRVDGGELKLHRDIWNTSRPAGR